MENFSVSASCLVVLYYFFFFFNINLSLLLSTSFNLAGTLTGPTFTDLSMAAWSILRWFWRDSYFASFRIEEVDEVYFLACFLRKRNRRVLLSWLLFAFKRLLTWVRTCWNETSSCTYYYNSAIGLGKVCVECHPIVVLLPSPRPPIVLAPKPAYVVKPYSSVLWFVGTSRIFATGVSSYNLEFLKGELSPKEHP